VALLATVLASGGVEAQRSGGLRHVVLSVPATDSGWRPTELRVAVGDLIVVRATGYVGIGRFSRDVDASGIPAGGSGGLGHVYLELRVGNAAPKPAGTNTVYAAQAAGGLYFRVHDARYDDNAGAFSVDVLVIPDASIPPAVMPGEAGVLPSGEVIDRMKSFLKMFATAEEAYFAERSHYANDYHELAIRLPPEITVERLVVPESGNGWSVVVRHEILLGVRCATAINASNPLDPAATDMQIVCK
jgi:hypothetical protein